MPQTRLFFPAAPTNASAPSGTARDARVYLRRQGDAMGRKRTHLVPNGAVEIFEVRIALYFDADGTRQVESVVSTPDDTDLEDVDLVELIGAIRLGEAALLDTYGSGVEP